MKNRYLTNFISIYLIVFLLVIPSSIFSYNNDIKIYEKDSGKYISLEIDSKEEIRYLIIEDNGITLDKYESSIIKTNKNKIENIVLLIQNCIDPDVSNYETLTKEALLYFRNSIPANINVFSYEYSNDLSEVNFWNSELLSIIFNKNNTCRLFDILTVLSYKYNLRNNDSFIIINIGSGRNSNSLQKNYLPLCPIIFYNLKPDKETELNFISEISDGFIINEIDKFNYNNIKNSLKNDGKLNKYIFLIEKRNYLELKRNHLIKIKLNEKEYSVSYKSNIIKTLFILIIGLFLLTVLSLIIILFIKNRDRKYKKKTKTEANIEIISEGERKQFKINKNSYSIGSSNICDLIIDDFEVSAFHCIIKMKNDLYEVIDNESRKGVFVNSTRINRKMLTNNDLIRIGSTIIIFKLIKNEQ